MPTTEKNNSTSTGKKGGKKDFTNAVKRGIDNLIQDSTPVNNEENIEPLAKTSIQVPEALYMEFKMYYLIPKKINLKDFVKEAMQKALLEEKREK